MYHISVPQMLSDAGGLPCEPKGDFTPVVLVSCSGGRKSCHRGWGDQDRSVVIRVIHDHWTALATHPCTKLCCLLVACHVQFSKLQNPPPLPQSRVPWLYRGSALLSTRCCCDEARPGGGTEEVCHCLLIKYVKYVAECVGLVRVHDGLLWLRMGQFSPRSFSIIAPPGMSSSARVSSSLSIQWRGHTLR